MANGSSARSTSAAVPASAAETEPDPLRGDADDYWSLYQRWSRDEEQYWRDAQRFEDNANRFWDREGRQASTPRFWPSERSPHWASSRGEEAIDWHNEVVRTTVDMIYAYLSFPGPWTTRHRRRHGPR
jgi:hypothetical protein